VILLDLEGRSVAPLTMGSERASVFLFTRTDCPISNRYAPVVRKLHDRFSSRGVSFWLVYVDPDQSPDEIGRHVAEYGYPSAALRDPGHSLVAVAGATVTPEAAVFVPTGSGPRLAYRGRIDDRHSDLGVSRREASSRDLEGALEAILAGRPVRPAATRAVGCYIADLS